MLEKAETFFKELNIKTVLKIVFHAPSKLSTYKKIVGRLVKIKNEFYIQLEQYTDKQVFHRNVTTTMFSSTMINYLKTDFKKMLIQTTEHTIDIIKQGEDVIILKKEQKETLKAVNLEHNNQRKYLLVENTIVPPLIDLGIFTSEGKIVKAKYDKYKQINRFLEMVNDVVKEWSDKPINIIDFGCGKSYLTFILYYFLNKICNKDITITGLDLKADVIKNCNDIAQKYGYEKLHFVMEDIKDYAPKQTIDMVISLHACDTATDYVLYHAIKWQTKAVLAVPCCQHEVNHQIKNTAAKLLIKHGIVKERVAALMTDVIRANLLELHGYDTQLLEFVDLSHSPKNLLLRAVKKTKNVKTKKILQEELDTLLTTYQIYPKLCQLLEYKISPSKSDG